MLSEVKLNDPHVISKIKNVLALNRKSPYELILNSGSSARGVVIIINSNLFDAYTYTITYRCPDYNALVVKFTKFNITYQIVCNYLDNKDNLTLIQTINSYVEKDLPGQGLGR